MNERERLIKLIEDGSCSYLSTEKCKNLMCECRTCCEQVLADNLLKNGVIVPPVKIGETVYERRSIQSIEDMRKCIQEWYAEVCTLEQLAKMHFDIKEELENQFVYMTRVITKELNKDE